MIQYRDPAHYLKALKTTTTPKRLMWLDCSALAVKEQGMFVDRWRCASLGTTHYTSRKNAQVNALLPFDDVFAMWCYADSFCTTGRRVVLWAYDLAYQLRVSQALVHLPAMGWHLDKIVLEKTAAWCLLHDGKRSLMMCDLKSWMPVELGRIASDLAGTNMTGIEVDAGPEYQQSRCHIRCMVVRDAVLQILNWIEGENLGPFRPTGSGQSYSAYRRRFHTNRILVHDDTERLQVERVGMWTGRCEAWKHGKLDNGPYIEYDMQAAYCRIAYECEVPTIAAQVIDNPKPSTIEKQLVNRAVLAEVEVTTSVPVVPTRYGGRTVWPTGTFNTVLWDPELVLVMQYADSYQVRRLWTYECAPALRDFAGMVLDGISNQEQVYGPLPKRVMKHWSRCLVGRLGLRYRSWERFGWQHPPDLRLVTYIDTDEGTTTDMLIAGNDRLLLSDMTEAVESLPQIPGWVMSECRRRLWSMMVAVGLDAVCYLDTDSVIVGPTVQDDYNQLANHFDPDVWTPKGTYARMVIHGPRNLTCESVRRISGVPLRATQTAPLEFTGQVMRSIKESMRAGQLDCVASIPRRFVMDAPDLRRQHLPEGNTMSYDVQLPTITED